MVYVRLLILGLFLPAAICAGSYRNYQSRVESDVVNEERTKDWWEDASLYQIYPRSFKDSDGDGIGDLKGITQMLPYLKEIGIDGAWLSPIFKSPMVDFGYDIADFYDIQPEYGTLADFDEMVTKASELGIKIFLDFVPNHTSTESEWFLKSLNKEQGYEDYYVWHPGFPDPKNSSNRLPPSNWVSVFRKGSWTWRPERQEFYLHQFAVKQADLNYRNPAVIAQMKDVLTFWLKRNVSGFRMDSIPYIYEKDKDSAGNFLNEPVSGESTDPDDWTYLNHIYTKDQPENIDLVYQWRELVDDFQKENGGDTRIILTEAYSPINIIMQCYGNETHKGAHVPFNFKLIENSIGSATDFAKNVHLWLDNMPTGHTANWVLGNHDRSRIAARYGVDKIDLFNMLLMVLPGVIVTYNGEEIGMNDVSIPWENTVDPQACNSSPTTYLQYTRDPQRTPFQWDDSTSAGFSSNTSTWLPVSPDYGKVNVERQRNCIKSHLHTYINAKELRSTKTFKNGEFDIQALNDNILQIIRKLSGETTYVAVANFGSRLERTDISAFGNLPDILEVVVSSLQSPRRPGESIDSKEVLLLPNEALILKS